MERQCRSTFFILSKYFVVLTCFFYDTNSNAGSNLISSNRFNLNEKLISLHSITLIAGPYHSKRASLSAKLARCAITNPFIDCFSDSPESYPGIADRSLIYIYLIYYGVLVPIIQIQSKNGDH